jgi:hypothetical protein
MADINKSTTLPLPETKSSYLTGADGATTWIDRTSRDLLREQPSLTKTILEGIIVKDTLHKIVWKQEAQIAAENPNRSAALLADLLTSSNSKSIKESEQFDSAQSAAYGWIYKSYGVTSLEVLGVDPDFKHNDTHSRCPLISWKRFIATHITERDGAGEELEVSNLNDALAKFANIAQLSAESISEYHDRFLRFDKTLLRQGIDSSRWLDTEKKRAIKFYQGMCEARHGQIKRDLANGSITTPNSISLLIVLVRKRKEAPTKNDPARKVAFVTTDSPGTHLIAPIAWYPKPTVEQRSMPEAERRMRMDTNEALIKAFTMCMKAGGPGTSRSGWVSYDKYVAARDSDPRDNIDEKKVKGRKEPRSKVLMIKNEESDDDLDDRNRVLLSYHQAWNEQPDIHHRSCLTNSEAGDEDGDAAHTTSPTEDNSTWAYEQQLRNWERAKGTSNSGVSDEVRVTNPIIYQASTDRVTATEANHLGSGNHGYACSASDLEHPPPLVMMESDSESDSDTTSHEHCVSQSVGQDPIHMSYLVVAQPSEEMAAADSSKETASKHAPSNPTYWVKPTYWVMALGPNAGKVYANRKTMEDSEKGAPGAYRMYRSSIAAQHASESILAARTSQDRRRTEQKTAVLQYDTLQHPHYSAKIARVPQHQLEVKDSKYRAVNGDGWVVPVGRGLTCTHTIVQGTEIAVFRGVPTDIETIASKPEDQQGYVIDMSPQGSNHHSHIQQLIDCYPNSIGSRPECLASMANDPTGLYNRLQDSSLGGDDANSAVIVGRRGNKIEAVLYAICTIKPGEEILWEYHSRPTDDEHQHSDTTETDDVHQHSGEPRINRGDNDTIESISHDTARNTTNSEDPGVASGDRHMTENRGDIDTIESISHAPTRNTTDSEESGVTKGDRCMTDSTSHEPSEIGVMMAADGGSISTDGDDHGVTSGSSRNADCNMGGEAESHCHNDRVTNSVIEATENTINEHIDDNHVVLDTSATAHVCKSQLYANDPAPCTPGRITGAASGEVAIEYVDDCIFISECFGRAALVPKAAFNIIALSEARKAGVFIAYHYNTDQFSFTTSKEEVFVFGRALSEHGSSIHYTMDMSTNRPPVSEATDIRRMFSYVENSDADLAYSFVMSHVYASDPMRRDPPDMERSLSKLASTMNSPIQSEDIRRCFRIHELQAPSHEYENVTWRATAVVDQTAEVSTLECGGFTYLVCLLNPMGYSLCVELTPSVTVRVAITSILDSCSKQHIRVDGIVTSGDTLLSSTLYHAIDTNITLREMSPGSVLGAITRRMAMIKSAVQIILTNSTNPIIKYLSRYLTIGANMQCNRGRTAITSDRPTESFLRRRMEYSKDVGLQIGSACIGTDTSGVRKECIYLYPETECSGAHVTLHLDDGTTQDKRQIVPTSYDRLLTMIVYGNPDSIAPASTRLDGLDAYNVQTSRTGDDAGNPISNLAMSPSDLRELFSGSMFRS